MKKLLLSGVALLALAGVAQAADMGARVYNKAPVPMVPLYNWTGFYVGGHLGYAWGQDNFGLPAFNNTSNNSGFAGGVQVGADWQFNPNWVVGVEGQWTWTDLNRNGLVAPAIVATEKTDSIGSLTGRLGYTWGPGLIYGKGGVAWADRSLGLATPLGVPVAFASSGNNDTGWTLGAGLEYMIAPSWSAKVEYQYYNFGNRTFLTAPAAFAGVSNNDDIQTIKFGLNYRFNWGAPVASRY